MAITSEKRKSWTYVPTHYEGFPDNNVWKHIAPFRVIVRRLLASPYPDQVYAITSHESLGFSLQGNYPERLECPQVWLTPCTNSVKIQYWLKQREKLEVIDCSYEEAWEIIIRMVEQLINTTTLPE